MSPGACQGDNNYFILTPELSHVQNEVLLHEGY